MKINLSKSELEKLYKLFDYKEINMSIAELLFSTFEEKNYFANSKDNNDYYKKFLSYFSIPKEEENIFEKWVKGSISQLNNQFLDNNPYYKTVLPKLFIDKKYQLKYLEFEPFQPFSLNDIEVDENDYFKEISPISYFTTKTKYLALLENGTVWMSITPNEINTMEKDIKEAKGNVLVMGLGLGYYPFMVSNKEDVNKITIVEMNKDIIDIFKNNILPLFPHKEKIEVINDDATKYIKKNHAHYDTIFIDLWHNPNDGLSLFSYFKKQEKYFKNTTFQYWLNKSLIALGRRLLLTIIEESLNGYSDNDYKEVHEEIDTILNELYFKTKNITINQYSDIYNLLKDKNISELFSR